MRTLKEAKAINFIKCPIVDQVHLIKINLKNSHVQADKFKIKCKQILISPEM